MRKTVHFPFVLALFLLVPASIMQAQKITQEKGLTTAVFNVPQGTVKIYLPDDIRQGDVITGTVTATPDGRNEKQKERNLAELARYAFSFNGQRFNLDPAGGSLRFMSAQINQPQQNIGLYFDKSTNPTQQLSIPPKPINEQKPKPAQCVIPGHVVTGSPMNIPGPFDGNAANTQCTIGNQPATILAESPRDCTVSFPANANGMQPVLVQENGQNACNRNVSAVQLEVSAGKLNLVKGENTFIDVRITGLQNLEQTATLTINNLTTETVKLLPSNIVVIPLEAAAVSGGIFQQRFDIQSLRTGGFTCNVNLDFGDVMLSPGNEPIGPGGNMPVPGLVVVQGKDCRCAVKASVSLFKVENDIVTYMAMPHAGCSGEKCAYKNDLKFKWQILSGNNNAEIIETSATGFEIKVKRKNGGYTIKNTATVTCSDGTTCTDDVVINEKGEEIPGAGIGDPEKPKTLIVKDNEFLLPVDSIPDKNIRSCARSTADSKLPKMDGGLKLGTFGHGADLIVLSDQLTIKRDEFIPLVAEGADFDTFIIQCSPSNDNCVEAKTVKLVPLSGKVRFEWEILGGPGKGQFVKLGCLFTNTNDGQKTEGDQVIFMPPVLQLPLFPGKEISVTTKIKLSIIDDKETLKDLKVDREFEIITRRTIDLPEVYKVEIVYKHNHTLPRPISKEAESNCKAMAGEWENKTDIIPSEIILPVVPDSDKMVLGQWIVLEAKDQVETDVLPDIKCGTGCGTVVPYSKTHEDNVQWNWTATGGNGKFVGGRTGRYVIYQAPTVLPKGKTEMDVFISVTASNQDGVQASDKERDSEKIKITVYQPGIKMYYPAKDWLPEYNNSVTVTSELLYNNNGKWEPALSHMCRILYFELIDVSQERGITMNDPIYNDADNCADLQFMNSEIEGNFEVYAPVDFKKKRLSKCILEDQFMMTRTVKPLQKFTVDIYSRDFGSYGFIRSFANTNTIEGVDEDPPFYQSIPWLENEVSHPLTNAGPPRLKARVYTDNRVNIPVDIDENRIPDQGWKSIKEETETTVPDPPRNNMDEDDLPLGNKTKGDGLPSYEEYRGFSELIDKNKVHTRTNPAKKDVFIYNRDNLDISLFKTVTGLDVHEVAVGNILSDSYQMSARVINFNFNNGSPTHIENQRGLRLVDAGYYEGLLGIACPSNVCPLPGTVAPPNWIYEIRIYTASIAKACSAKGMKPEDKLAQVVAHELCHGVNVCHHGEGDPFVDGDFNRINGLRSGEFDCVMRYDNSGIKVTPGGDAESIGKILCKSPVGTGYNITSDQPGFGNAAAGRGNCANQIQVIGGKNQPAPCKQ